MQVNQLASYFIQLDFSCFDSFTRSFEYSVLELDA